MSEAFLRHVGPVTVWRCTEAVDPKSGYALRTIGHAEGRCVEIATSRGTLLFDRRLAREIAEAVLAIAGPAEAVASDLATTDMVEIVYDEVGAPASFRPYVSRTGKHAGDVLAVVDKVRSDMGAPPSDLIDRIRTQGLAHG